jgi:hypothetical protein
MVMVLGFLGVPKLHEFGLMLFVGTKKPAYMSGPVIYG